jgi:hypothetical protein
MAAAPSLICETQAKQPMASHSTSRMATIQYQTGIFVLVVILFPPLARASRHRTQPDSVI